MSFRRSWRTVTCSTSPTCVSTKPLRRVSSTSSTSEQNVGASLLAIASCQSTTIPADTPPSRASSLPQILMAGRFQFNPQERACAITSGCTNTV
ncbi:hypothetical protein FPT12_22990 [Pseudomonas sp. H3(2019)]|nr:hypothetical protein FPT12_22990 [Pseudomonas sp. H3(2019)]